MQISNKICFYLNHTRDISMFANIFTKINHNKVCFVFNDLFKEKKKLANDWFKVLQEKIIDQFQLIENENKKKNNTKPKYFIKKKWEKNNKKEGGGN